MSKRWQNIYLQARALQTALQYSYGQNSLGSLELDYVNNHEPYKKYVKNHSITQAPTVIHNIHLLKPIRET